MSKNSASSSTPSATPELPVTESPQPETTKIRTQSFNATYTAPSPSKWKTKDEQEFPTLGA